MFSKSALTALAMLGLSFVDAHIIMTYPVPYNEKDLKLGTLNMDGSDFPCQNVGYGVVTENHLVKGQPKSMRFRGGATHGGGSCQISITKDRAPTKDTQWSVIQSIEGGCMDPNEGGTNAGDNAEMKTPFSLSFSIPDSFEDGKYTLAWTWINRIGNREFYMNCAPITVSGGSSSKRSEVATVQKRAEDYPPMFIANINGCKTEHQQSPRYPMPGPNVISFSKANLYPSSEVCRAGSSPTWGDAAYGSDGSSTEPTMVEDSGAASTPATTESSTPSVSVGGAVNIPGDFATEEPPAVQTTEPAADPTPSSTFESVAAPTGTTAPSTGSSAVGAMSGPCMDEGAWNCISGTSFQRCASGAWSDVQPLASGTECTPGQTMDFAIKAVGVKSRMLKEKRRRSSHLHDHA